MLDTLNIITNLLHTLELAQNTGRKEVKIAGLSSLMHSWHIYCPRWNPDSAFPRVGRIARVVEHEH